jgi:hypothetical protein
MTPGAAIAQPDVVEAAVSVTTAGPDPVLERVAAALRGARARTGLSEERVVAILAEKGIAGDVRALRRAERTGMIDLAFASHLADLYGTTTDCMAGRRPNRQQVSSLDLGLR